MAAYSKTVKVAAALIAAVGLHGCSTQYVFPKAGEPSATVRMSGNPTEMLTIRSFDEKGCYAGPTGLRGESEDTNFKIRPGQQMVMSYTDSNGVLMCQVTFAFTPEQDAIYTIKPRKWSEPVKVLGILNGQQGMCGIVVHKRLGTEERIEPVQHGYINEGFICSKWVRYE